jgi:hypothetical protein
MLAYKASHRPFSSGNEKSAPLNWRRGMFRLWVLISAAWIMGWVIYVIIDGLKAGFTVRDLAGVAVVLFGPPLALFLLGLGTRWAFRGFSMDGRTPKA